MISIAMCTYNGARYIREQIDSVLRQTESDFELVVCDDCSMDDTMQILTDYAQTDKRIHVYRNEENLGFYKNFEKALGLCHGDYIAPCDQDDVWTEDHLEKLLTILGNRTLACGNSELMDTEGNLIGMTLSEQEHLCKVPSAPLDQALTVFLCRNPFQGANMLFRHDFLDKALPFPEGFKYHDVWFAALAGFENGLSYTYDIINHYRIHGNNASGSHECKERKQLIINALNNRFYLRRKLLLVPIRERGILDTIKKKYFWYKIKSILNNSTKKRAKYFSIPFIILHLRSIISV